MAGRILFISSLSAIAQNYDAVFCDVWGVVHDGAAIYPSAAEALVHFRQAGGSIILLSNASRLSTAVTPELGRLGLPSTAYDALITSGDIARGLLSLRPGASIFDVGPASARPLCEGLDLHFSSLERADLAVSAGAFQNDTLAMDQLNPMLQAMWDRRLPLLCANPDAVTQIGGRRVKCAGALGELYAEMGGPMLHVGKPHAEIFNRALTLAEELHEETVPRERVLVIGDSVHTDMLGAFRSGFDSLFVMSGIHAQDMTDSDSEPTLKDVEKLFAGAGFTPTAATRCLAW